MRVLEHWVGEKTPCAILGLWLLSLGLLLPSAISAEKLRVSYASVTGNTAVLTYIAQRAGLFEKQGLDVEIILITGGPAAVSALLNGDVDLDLRAPIAAIQAMAHGAKFLLSYSPNPIHSNTTLLLALRLRTLSSSRVKGSASFASAAFQN